jgi:transcriptional regulator with XRE-family HTH domain
MKTRTGYMIRKRRMDLNLNQFEVSKELKLTTSQFISNLERGHSPLPAKMIPALSRILKLNVNTLIKLHIADYEIKLRRNIKLRSKIT